MDIEARLKAASTAERYRVIVDAREAGWTFRRIADVIGLSVGAVHNIIQKGAPK
jgi:DNA-directed RNA polymerase specialized sigma24 family protein